MSAVVEKKGKRLKVKLEADLDAARSEALRLALMHAMEDDTERVTLDLAKVDHLSAHALSLLYAVHKRLGSKPSRVVLLGVCPPLLRLFTMLGLDQEFALAFRA